MTGTMSTSAAPAAQGGDAHAQRDPLVIAHRGDSLVAPENTMAAFAAAAAGGADMIEIDLHMSADGEGIVIHDGTVDRTTDASGAVGDLDVAEIARFDAGSWFDPAFGGQHVPLIGDVLELLERHPRVRLLLEFKDPWDEGPLRRVLGEIQDAGLAERVLVQSFFPPVLQTLRTHATEIPRGLIATRFDEQVLATCAELDVVACNPRHTLVAADPQIVDQVHAAGLQIMVWTPNEPEQWEPLVAAGVDGIITDRPDRLRGFLQVRDGAHSSSSAPSEVPATGDGQVPAGGRGPVPAGAQAAQG